MNAEEVVAMIDAITEGKAYLFDLSGEMTVVSSSKDISFVDVIGEPLSSIDNTRKARELAGLLVAWANHKESNDNK